MFKKLEHFNNWEMNLSTCNALDNYNIIELTILKRIYFFNCDDFTIRMTNIKNW